MEQDGAIVLQKNSGSSYSCTLQTQVKVTEFTTEFTKFFNYHISKQLTTGLMSKNERTWLP